MRRARRVVREMVVAVLDRDHPAAAEELVRLAAVSQQLVPELQVIAPERLRIRAVLSIHT